MGREGVSRNWLAKSRIAQIGVRLGGDGGREQTTRWCSGRRCRGFSANGVLNVAMLASFAVSFVQSGRTTGMGRLRER